MFYPVDPTERPPPDNPVAQIHAFALALASGVTQGKWPDRIDANHPQLRDYLQRKWGRGYPSFERLISFGYLERVTISNSNDLYFRLTLKAFELLENPTERPQVFIAYGTQESSAFGLAIEYRLESLDIPVFIDRSIPLGEDWDNHLIERIQQSKYMLCLLAPTTLSRPGGYVCKEIELAKQNPNCVFISIQHYGYDPNENGTLIRFDPKKHFGACSAELREFVEAKQAVRVNEHNAKGYHDAVEDLINRLGFSSLK